MRNFNNEREQNYEMKRALLYINSDP